MIQKAHPVIAKIAKYHKKSGVFAYYTADDIEQEIWVLCLDALSRYDESKAELENFLRSHVSNRLKNLKRDKYYRPEKNPSPSGAARARMNLVNAISLNNDLLKEGRILCGSEDEQGDPLEQLMAEETCEYIIEKLPHEFVEIFCDMINGNRVRKPVRQEVCDLVAKILKEREEDE